MARARSLILLSCSRDKRPGGELYRSDGRSICLPRFLPDTVSDKLLKKRAEVLDLLRGKSGRLRNEDQKGGFRDERRSNQNLHFGPDFGAQGHGRDVYLQA